MPATRPSPDNRPRGPVLAVTMGDPLGIGPEIIVKALAGAPAAGGDAPRFRVFGSVRVLEAAASSAGVPPFWSGDSRVTVVDDDAFDPALLAGVRSPCAAAGAASFRWVLRAIDAASLPPGDAARVDALITAPISKASWSLAGHREYPGHTELLGARLGRPGEPSGMLFVGPGLRVMLATIHWPLARVCKELNQGHVLEAIRLAAGAAAELGVSGTPRIAVCGLNPHAGEGGLLGTEDAAVIAPAVESARREGIDASGPWPADTVFGTAVVGRAGQRFDCVVAMYHDQGLIPAKLLDGERSVNVTVGLTTVRTSPAHGTAFDIAGKNRASAVSMRAAIDLALDLLRRKSEPGP